MKFQELKHRFNKKYAVRIIAGVLTIALVGTGSAVYSVSIAKAENEKDHSVETVSQAGEESLLSTLLSGVTVDKKEIAKEETVYLITDANGSVTKTIVSDRLSNPNGKDTLEDKSNLKDIENVKGDEDYTESNGKLTWNAGGKEICYQGTTEKSVPVTTAVSYYLDGKKITPDELAGKSGKVTIRFDYTNNTEYTAKVDGKNVKTKVPFAALSALMLSDNFTNVEVTNGQIKTSDGRSVVVGYALPGMTEALGVEEGQLPEYFEVTADVEKFELKTAMTIVLNAANYASTSGVDLSKVEALIEKLTDATDQLSDGSNELASGLDTLSSSLSEFVTGMQTLNNGKNALAAGVNQLHTSAQSLNEATGSLEAALKATITEGEKARYAALAKASVDSTFANGLKDDTVHKVYLSLRYNEDQTDSAIYTTLYAGALKSTVDAQYQQKVKEVLKQALESAGVPAQTVDAMTVEDMVTSIETAKPEYTNYSEAQLAEALYAAADAQVPSSSTGLTLHQAVEAGVMAQGGEQIKAVVEERIRQIATGIVEKAVIPGAETAAAGALIQGIEQTKANILAQITTVQDNGYSFVTGMAALAAGTTQLSASVPSLTEGITRLTDASLLIQDGANKLDEGSHQLADGIKQFSEEGIEKLVNTYNGDIKELAGKVQAALDAGESYQVFTDLANGANGSVKFIYKLGSITVK